jgi:hypothetical protein
MLPVLIISVCAEPIVTFIVLLMAKLPDIPKEQVDLVMGREGDVEGAVNEKFQVPQGPFETALVIPCHDTDHTAMRTSGPRIYTLSTTDAVSTHHIRMVTFANTSDPFIQLLFTSGRPSVARTQPSLSARWPLAIVATNTS